MHADTDAHDAVRGTAMERLRDLEVALSARDITVRIEQKRWSLVAKNEAAEPSGPLGRHLAPGLSQTVALSTKDDGSLHWYWQWSGATRDSAPEYEYLCPAAAIAEATERISRVLALAGQ